MFAFYAGRCCFHHSCKWNTCVRVNFVVQCMQFRAKIMLFCDEVPAFIETAINIELLHQPMGLRVQCIRVLIIIQWDRVLVDKCVLMYPPDPVACKSSCPPDADIFDTDCSSS